MKRKHLVAVLLWALAAPAVADTPPPRPTPPRVADLGPTAPAPRARWDLAEVQALMAVQRLDGWLLYDAGGLNPVAREVVAPKGAVSRRWFYLIPAKGDPVALVPRAEAAAFAGAPGRRVEYGTWRELDVELGKLLKGRKRVAMEYSPGGALPELGRVDAGTIEKVQKLGVTVVSSADIVQAARSRWGKDGRASHYVAAHHLASLAEETFAWLAAERKAGRAPTEFEVARWAAMRFGTRGLEGPMPVVAAGPNTASPGYAPDELGARAIQQGDLVVLRLAARQTGVPLAVWATGSWVAYVGDKVPARAAALFAAAVAARDAAIALMKDRARSGKVVRGYEVDQAARAAAEKAGYGDAFVERLGHSIDTRRHGDGANLDDVETHDVRTLLLGTGYAVAPGLFVPGELGVRTEVDVFFGASGLEVTATPQEEILPLLAK